MVRYVSVDQRSHVDALNVLQVTKTTGVLVEEIPILSGVRRTTEVSASRWYHTVEESDWYHLETYLNRNCERYCGTTVEL